MQRLTGGIAVLVEQTGKTCTRRMMLVTLHEGKTSLLCVPVKLASGFRTSIFLFCYPLYDQISMSFLCILSNTYLVRFKDAPCITKTICCKKMNCGGSGSLSGTGIKLMAGTPRGAARANAQHQHYLVFASLADTRSALSVAGSFRSAKDVCISVIALLLAERLGNLV